MLIVPSPINGFGWKDRQSMEKNPHCSVSMMVAMETNLPDDLGGLILYLANGMEALTDRTVNVLTQIPRLLPMISSLDQDWYRHLASRINDLKIFKSGFESLPAVNSLNALMKRNQELQKQFLQVENDLVASLSSFQDQKVARRARKALAQCRREYDELEQDFERLKRQRTATIENLEFRHIGCQNRKLKRYVSEMVSLRMKLYPGIDEDLIETDVEEEE